MSILTTNPMLLAPAAGAATNVSPLNATWGYGSWVQFISGLSGVAQIAGLIVYPGSWSSQSLDIDFGIGLAGLETSIASPVRLELGNSGATGITYYPLPTPITGYLPLGAAVSLRARSNATGAVPIKLIYYINLDSDHAIPYVAGSYPVAASPATLTPSGVAWTDSTAAVLIASLPNDVYAYGLGILFPGEAGGTGFDYEIDLCTGATSATVISTLSGGSGGSINNSMRMAYLHLPVNLKIVGSTKVAVKVRQSTTSIATYKVALLYYDAPTPPSPPTPATDYPCNMKEPVFWGALGASGSVLKFGKKPLRDLSTAWSYGGYGAPRILDIGDINTPASDWLSGAWPSQSATIKLADTDHYFRNLGQPDLINADLHLYLNSEVTRLARGNPALIFRGPVFDDPLGQTLTVSLMANDVIGVSYNLFGQDKMVPQRTLTSADFNLLSGKGGLGVPIIGGSHIKSGGAIKGLTAGTIVVGGTTYVIVICAGHACAGGITGAYDESGTALAWGTDAFAPGQASWTTIQPSGALYFDINGNRYTFIAIDATTTLGTDVLAGASVWFDTDGYEPNGDGTGSVETDLLPMYYWLLNNWYTQSYTSGPYLSPATFYFYPYGAATNDVLDLASFTAAQTVSGQYVGGGFQGKFVIGAQGRRQSVRQAVAEANVSCNVIMRLSNTQQLGVVMFDNVRSTFIGSTRTITQRRDILAQPRFNIKKMTEWFKNNLAYQYDANYRDDGTGSWDGFNTNGHAPSIVKYGSKPGSRVYPLVGDAATADAIAGQQLTLGGADPPRVAEWAQSICGMNNQVGAGLPITGYNGTGANGWVDNAVWVLGRRFNPRSCRTFFTGFDVQPYMV